MCRPLEKTPIICHFLNTNTLQMVYTFWAYEFPYQVCDLQLLPPFGVWCVHVWFKPQPHVY